MVVVVVDRVVIGTNLHEIDVQTHLKPSGMIGGQEGGRRVLVVVDDDVGIGTSSQ